jgi:RNA polymerase sigma-70 factor (ECF subfamily)
MTVRKILGATHPDLDDVAQDAVIALLDALETFRADCSVMTFARRVALLTALSARRKSVTRHKYQQAAADLECESTSVSPQSALLAKQRRELLLRCLDDLPPATAEALALHFVLGMTIEEIAASTNAPQNTVWSRLRLGKQSLRRRVTLDSGADLLIGGAE